jgi:hypothetical protein
MARRAGQPGRFLFPVTSTEHRMTPRAWLHWNRRYAKECKDIAAISEAFIAYRRIYGKDQSAEVESLATGNPVEAKSRTAICWLPGTVLDRPYRAAKAMSEMMKGYGWNLVTLGRKTSSHSGRKTGVSALDALTKGRSRSQIMEWMLVTDEILVARYCEREYIVTSFVAEMFDWMALQE